MRCREQLLRLFFFAILGGLALVLPPAAAKATPSGGSTTAGCGCPTIAPVATSDKPAHGRVPGELSLRDLELYMSDREARYGGDWDQAMLALAHDIDPAGTLGLSTGPPPKPTTPSATVTEGGESYLLVNGVSYTAAVRAHLLPQNTQLRIDPDNGGILIARIVATLARINKYGEPEFGLRKALLSVAHFLVNDLARVPRQPPYTQARAQEIAQRHSQEITKGSLSPDLVASARRDLADNASRGARAALGAIIAAGDPTGTAVARARQGTSKQLPYSEDDRHWGKEAPSLDLDAFDMANAALDIVMTVDDKGHITNLWSARADIDWGVDGSLPGLADLAALSSKFGGPATAKSAAEAVGCKAFAVLAALIDYRNKDGAVWHRIKWLQLEVQEGFAPEAKALASTSAVDRADPNSAVRRYRGRFLALRAALAAGGWSDPAEAKTEAQYLLTASNPRQVGQPGSDDAKRLELVMATMRDWEQLGSGPAHAVFSDTIDQEWARRRKIDNDRIQSGMRGSDYTISLQYWDKSRPDMTRADIEKVCASPGAAPRLMLVAKGAFHDFVIDKIYVGVPMAIDLVFDEPYGGDSYPLTLDLGGSKTPLLAKPVDDTRRVFETETIVPQP